MRSNGYRRFAAVVALTIGVLAWGGSAPAQSPPAGLGDQLFATGGEITVEVLRSRAVYTSELRLHAADGTFTRIAVNRETGRIVTLPAVPKGEELVFGIYVRDTGFTYKIGPADRNPDNLAHAVVTQTGERQFKVGFEDLHGGGDRSFNDNAFVFRGGLAPNRTPVADDQAVTVAQGGSLAITLAGSDPDDDDLTFPLLDAPLHGKLTGTGATLTYTPQADFSGLDTFGFSADDGTATDEGRITITVTPTPVTGAASPTGGSSATGSGISLADCPAGELTLLNVRRIGRRVRLTGLAEGTLAGAPVNIIEGGLVVARTTIRPDGTFGVRVVLPSSRGGRALRYQAQLGVLRSRNIRLRRRMITTSAGLKGRRIVITGRVTGARRKGTRPVVRLIARPRGCNTRKTIIGSARLRRDGSFSVSAKPLAGVDIAVYQVRSRLNKGLVSYSLPQPIARR